MDDTKHCVAVSNDIGHQRDTCTVRFPMYHPDFRPIIPLHLSCITAATSEGSTDLLQAYGAYICSVLTLVWPVHTCGSPLSVGEVRRERLSCPSLLWCNWCNWYNWLDPHSENLRAIAKQLYKSSVRTMLHF